MKTAWDKRQNLVQAIPYSLWLLPLEIILSQANLHEVILEKVVQEEAIQEEVIPGQVVPGEVALS